MTLFFAVLISVLILKTFTNVFITMNFFAQKPSNNTVSFVAAIVYQLCESALVLVFAHSIKWSIVTLRTY